MILNADKQGISDRSVYWKLFEIAIEITEKWEPLDRLNVGESQSMITEDLDPILECDDGGYSVALKLSGIIDLMTLYANGVSPDDYRAGGIGDPMQFLDYTLFQLSQKEHKPDHPFVKALGMATHRTTVFKCCECDSVIVTENCRDRIGGSFLCLFPSEEAGFTMPDLLPFYTSEKQAELDRYHAQYCSNCDNIKTIAKATTKFDALNTNEERVLILCVRRETSDHLLHHIDLSFDFTGYVDDHSGNKYEAHLTGFMEEPKTNHFASVTKARHGDVFFFVDDMAKAPMNVGKLPESYWGRPTYLFYSVKNVGMSSGE